MFPAVPPLCCSPAPLLLASAALPTHLLSIRFTTPVAKSNAVPRLPILQQQVGGAATPLVSPACSGANANAQQGRPVGCTSHAAPAPPSSLGVVRSHKLHRDGHADLRLARRHKGHHTAQPADGQRKWHEVGGSAEGAQQSGRPASTGRQCRRRKKTTRRCRRTARPVAAQLTLPRSRNGPAATSGCRRHRWHRRPAPSPPAR